MHHDSSLVSTHFPGPTPPRLLAGRSNGLALAEGAVLLVGLSLLDYAGVMSFADWPVHPFLFAVVLLSALYGIVGGILAALAAIGPSYIDGWPARPLDMSYAAYFGYVWSDACPGCWPACGRRGDLEPDQCGSGTGGQAAQGNARRKPDRDPV